MQNPRKANTTGFTLVEVIVSLIIILLTATGVFSSFISSQRYVIRTSHRVTAADFAREKLEELRMLNKAQINALTGLGWQPDDTGETLPGDFGQPSKWNGRRLYQVNPVTTTITAITAKIVWDEPTY